MTKLNKLVTVANDYQGYGKHRQFPTQSDLDKIRKGLKSEVAAAHKRKLKGLAIVAVAMAVATMMVGVVLWRQTHDDTDKSYSLDERGQMADLLEATTPLGQE